MSKAGSICSVYDCKNYSWQKNSLSQFRFPRDKEICAQWVDKCGSLKLQEIFKNRGSLYASYKICSKHFAVTDFRNPNLTSQGLKKGVVPSLHICPLGSLPNPSQTNAPSTEKSSNKKKTVSKAKTSMSSSSKDEPNDAQSLRPTRSKAPPKKQPTSTDPVISAVPGTSTTQNVSKRTVFASVRQKTVKDNKPKVPPISLYKSKTSSVRETELPVNQTCAALYCASQSNSMPGSKFHHFPINKIRARQWAISCDRPDLIDLDPVRLHNNYVLCSLHFEKDDFTDDLRSCLGQFAIPTKVNNSDHNISETSSSSSLADFGMSTSVIKAEPAEANLISELQTSQGPFHENFPEYNTDGDQHGDSQESVCADKNTLCSTSIRASLKNVATQTDLPWKNKTAAIADNSTIGVFCRLCACMMQRSQMVHIFKQSDSDSKQYIYIINQLLPSSEQVTENDNMPQWICNDCCGILDYCEQAMQGFLAANRKLKDLLCSQSSDRGTKMNRAPTQNTMPCLKLTRPVFKDSVKEEVTVDDCESIKEEVIDEEQNDDDQYDATNEQLECGSGTSDQVEDQSSDDDDDAESVDLKVAKRKRKQMSYNLKSAPSDKLMKKEGQNHVRDSECLKNINKPMKSCLITNNRKSLKESKEAIIRSSHTTILTSKDKKTYFCQICDMLFASIEAALTHRFKTHSHEEFSNQIQI